MNNLMSKRLMRNSFEKRSMIRTDETNKRLVTPPQYFDMKLKQTARKIRKCGDKCMRYSIFSY